MPTTPHAVASISVVIPAKDEALNISWVLSRMPSYVDEIIIVDGLSRDGTVEIARAHSPDIVVVHEFRAGKGAAMRAGFDVATGDCVVVMDADGSMDPAEIDRYVRCMAGGADLVKGSRFVDGGGSSDITRLRAFGNGMLLRLANLLFRTQFTELCYGFMAVRRSSLLELQLDADGFEIETQIVARSIRAGLAIAEVPSHESARRTGQSNLNTFRDGWRVLRTIVNEWRRQSPSRMSSRRAIPIEPEVPLAPLEVSLAPLDVDARVGSGRT